MQPAHFWKKQVPLLRRLWFASRGRPSLPRQPARRGHPSPASWPPLEDTGHIRPDSPQPPSSRGRGACLHRPRNVGQAQCPDLQRAGSGSASPWTSFPICTTWMTRPAFCEVACWLTQMVHVKGHQASPSAPNTQWPASSPRREHFLPVPARPSHHPYKQGPSASA